MTNNSYVIRLLCFRNDDFTYLFTPSRIERVKLLRR